MNHPENQIKQAEPRKKGHGLQTLALVFALSPFVLFPLAMGSGLSARSVFGAILGALSLICTFSLPAAGLTIGILSLCQGKEKTGKTGLILAFIAVSVVSILAIGFTVYLVRDILGPSYEAAKYEMM